MRTILASVILILLRLPAIGQDGNNTGIIYGKNHAFSLTAPSGWLLDNKSGVNQGLHAVFYKQGQSWAGATAVMYANTASLEDDAHKTLEELMKYDLDNFKKNYADIEIFSGPDIVIDDKAIAKVKYLSGKSYGNYEAIAYIDAGKTGVLIIVSSRTADEFKSSISAFESLVKSYVLISKEVVDERKNRSTTAKPSHF